MEFEDEGILSEKNTEIFLQRGYEDIASLAGNHHMHGLQKREAKRLAALEGKVIESSKSARPSRIWAWTSSLIGTFAHDEGDMEMTQSTPASPQGQLAKYAFRASAFDGDDRRTSISTDNGREKIGNDDSDDDGSDDEMIIKQGSVKGDYRHKAIMKTEQKSSQNRDKERWDHGEGDDVNEEGETQGSGTGSPKKAHEGYDSESSDSDASDFAGKGASTRSIHSEGVELSASRRVSDIDAAMRDFEYREEHALDMHSEARRQSATSLAFKDIDDVQREFEEERESRKEELQLEQEEAERLLDTNKDT